MNILKQDIKNRVTDANSILKKESVRSGGGDVFKEFIADGREGNLGKNKLKPHEPNKGKVEKPLLGVEPPASHSDSKEQKEEAKDSKQSPDVAWGASVGQASNTELVVRENEYGVESTLSGGKRSLRSGDFNGGSLPLKSRTDGSSSAESGLKPYSSHELQTNRATEKSTEIGEDLIKRSRRGAEEIIGKDERLAKINRASSSALQKDLNAGVGGLNNAINSNILNSNHKQRVDSNKGYEHKKSVYFQDEQHSEYLRSRRVSDHFNERKAEIKSKTHGVEVDDNNKENISRSFSHVQNNLRGAGNEGILNINSTQQSKPIKTVSYTDLVAFISMEVDKLKPLKLTESELSVRVLPSVIGEVVVSIKKPEEVGKNIEINLSTSSQMAINYLTLLKRELGAGLNANVYIGSPQLRSGSKVLISEHLLRRKAEFLEDED